MNVDLNNIIKVIPQLLMYFIPGYIALEIKRGSRQESKYIDRDLIILSITYSFLIGLIVIISSSLFNWFINLFVEFNIKDLSDEWRIIANIIIAILFGYIITIYPDTRLASFVRKVLKSNSEPYSNVWNYAMKNPNGTWARVYLEEENILYVGMLIKYTIDPDEERKEIYLGSFSSYTIDNNKLIEDNSNNEEACILINATNLKRVEIIS